MTSVFGDMPTAGVDLTDCAALVVEDNIIIAMDVQAGLAALGAEPVHIAANNAIAMQVLDDHMIALAILDVNLGHETSITVAERLVASGIPFVFSTGYGERDSVMEKFSGVEILSKPFERDQLVAAIRRALAR